MKEIFDLEIDGPKTRDLGVLVDIESLVNSLYNTQEAIGIIANIIIELNRTTIEAALGLSSGATITSGHLKTWSNTL